MMTNPEPYLILATAGLTGLAMLTAAALAGWKSWVSLKAQELALLRGHDSEAPAPASTGARIEIADLKERIRKLEAIAAGVDL